MPRDHRIYIDYDTLWEVRARRATEREIEANGGVEDFFYLCAYHLYETEGHLQLTRCKVSQQENGQYSLELDKPQRFRTRMDTELGMEITESVDAVIKARKRRMGDKKAVTVELSDMPQRGIDKIQQNLPNLDVLFDVLKSNPRDADITLSTTSPDSDRPVKYIQGKGGASNMSVNVVEVGNPDKLKVGKTRDRERDKKSNKRPTITVTDALKMRDRAEREAAALEQDLLEDGDPDVVSSHIRKTNRTDILDTIEKHGHTLVYDGDDMVIHIPKEPTPGPYFRATFLEDGETYGFKWRRENGADVPQLIFSATRSLDNKIEPTKDQKDKAKAYYNANRDHCRQKWQEAVGKDTKVSHASKITEESADRANGSYRA